MLLLVAFELICGLAIVPLDLGFESDEGVEVAVGRFSFLIGVYVSKIFTIAN